MIIHALHQLCFDQMRDAMFTDMLTAMCLKIVVSKCTKRKGLGHQIDKKWPCMAVWCRQWLCLVQGMALSGLIASEMARGLPACLTEELISLEY